MRFFVVLALGLLLAQAALAQDDHDDHDDHEDHGDHDDHDDHDDHGSGEDRENNVGLAFGLSVMAGGATSIGGLAPYVPWMQSHKFMAGCLGVASGVMLFLTFVEIWTKAGSEFEAEIGDENDAGWAQLWTFFAGIFLVVALEYALHRFESKKPVPPVGARSDDVEMAPVEDNEDREDSDPPMDLGHSHGIDMKRTGLINALVLAAHNLPEGMVAFSGALLSKRVGVALALGVAIHNLPEGVAVAVPVCKATGSKFKGFMWATISGLTEPFGALLVYLILDEVFEGAVYGVLFALVGGMMLWIVLTQLLPTAFAHDKISTQIGLVGGMWAMALSLQLLHMSGGHAHDH